MACGNAFVAGRSGYVAVSKPLGIDGKRDVVVVFRGTQAQTEWASDIKWEMQPWSDHKTGHSDVKVAKVTFTIQGCSGNLGGLYYAFAHVHC